MPRENVPRANAAPASSLRPVSPTNTKTPVASRAVPSATPAAAKAGATAKNMDARTSLINVWGLESGDWGLYRRQFRLGLGFVNQLYCRTVQFAQFRFTRFVFGEFYLIAAFQKFAEPFLLLRRQQFRVLQLAQKFLRRPLRRAKVKTFLKIKPDCVGNQNAKRLRLRDEGQRFLKLLSRPDVRRHGWFERYICLSLLPPFPEREQNCCACEHGKRHPKPFPAARNRDWRFDVADVIGGE